MTEDWYKNWFDEKYLQLYSYRDKAEAETLVRKLLEVSAIRENGLWLDAACGSGRGGRALKQFGIPSVGFDYSMSLLRIPRMEDRLNPVCADMKAPPFKTGAFSGILCLFTSFGYWQDDSINRAVLLEYHRLLSVGALLILDFLNPQQVKKEFTDEGEDIIRREVKRSDITFRTEKWLDAQHNMVRKKITFNEGGEKHKAMEQVKLYNPEFLIRWFEDLGFSLIKHSGNYDLSDFDFLSPRSILVLSKVS